MASTAKLTITGHEWKPLQGSFDEAPLHDAVTGVGDLYELVLTVGLTGDHLDESVFRIEGSELFLAIAPGIDEGKYHFPRGSSPIGGFFGIIHDAPPGGYTKVLTPVGIDDAEKSLGDRNDPFGEMLFEFVSSSEFRLRIRGRHAMAWGEYMRSAKMRNRELFRKPDKRDYRLDKNEFRSVYNSEKAFGVHIKVEKAEEMIRVEAFYPYRLRWWNQKPDGSPMEGGLSVILRRGGVTVPELSAYEDTEVEVTITPVPGLIFQDNFSRVLVWADREGNEAVWFRDLQFGDTIPAPDLSNNQIDGLIYGPSAKWANGGGKFTTTFTIPKEEVEEGLQYYVGALAVLNTAIKHDHTQPMLKVVGSRSLPPPCPLPMTGKIFDYDLEYLDNYLSKAAPGDRYRLRLCLDTATYDACSDSSFMEDVSMVTMRVYEEYQEDDLIYETSQEPNPDNNFFSNTKRFGFVYSPGGLCIDFNLRSGVITNQSQFKDFANKTIIFRFDVWCSFPGAPQYANVYTYRFKIQYFKYENEYQPDIFTPQKIESITYYNAATGLPLYTFCDVDKVLIEVKLNAGHGSNGENIKFRGLLDRFPYGAGVQLGGWLKEHDGYLSDTDFTQLEQSPIIFTDEYFDANGVARMIVDASVIQLGDQHRVLAIKNKIDETP